MAVADAGMGADPASTYGDAADNRVEGTPTLPPEPSNVPSIEGAVELAPHGGGTLSLITLRFCDARVEQAFQQDMVASFRKQTQFAIPFTGVLYLLFAFLDPFLIGPNYPMTISLRVILLCVFGMVYVQVCSERFATYRQELLWSIFASAALVMFAILALAGSEGRSLYYAGASLIIIGCFVLYPFDFKNALIASALVFLSYCGLAAFAFDLSIVELLNNALFIFSTALLAGGAGYFLELRSRQNFIKRLELVESQRRLAEARDEAERANGAKSRMLEMISHELRTPLNTILSSGELAIRSGRASTHDLVRFEEIVRCGSALRTMIDNLLDIKRIEAEKFVPRAAAFSLDGVFEDLEVIVAATSEEENIELVCGIMSDVPDVLIGDRTRLLDILVNLVGNAIKFTHEGSVTVTAELCDETAAQRTVEHLDAQHGLALVRFAVTDTGPGIPENEFDLIFESLTQASNTQDGRLGGTGLGLSFVKTFVEAMGSEVELDSTVGVGTTFAFTLALPRSDAMDVPLPSTRRRARIDPATTTRNLDLLLVEDEPVNRDTAAELLRLYGHRVTTAGSGEEAIKIVESRRDRGQRTESNAHFDLILMDMRLPGINGLETSTYLMDVLTREAMPTRIFALTANVMPDDRRAYRNAGVVDVIEKPLDVDVLVSKLERFDTGATHAPCLDEARGREDLHQYDGLSAAEADETQMAKLARDLPPKQLAALLAEGRASIASHYGRLMSALDTGDDAAILDCSHALAGVASTYGRTQLARLARQVFADPEAARADRQLRECLNAEGAARSGER